jgi:hypothetical protein
MHATMNGKVRKSLAAQIDRLDSVLDGLADNLNDAVAMAVMAAVEVAIREAVKAVVTEVLANPQLVARMHAAGPALNSNHTTTVAEKPKGKLRSCLSSVRRWIGKQLSVVGQACHSAMDQVKQAFRFLYHGACQTCVVVPQQVHQLAVGAWQRLRILRHFKLQLLVAFGTGLALGAATYFAEPWFAAIASGIGGAALTVVVQSWLFVRRMFQSPAEAISAFGFSTES